MAASGPVTGQVLGHYRIVERIGAGGMGVVYRAHDERLDRDVALKVLSADMLSGEGARKRFRKEALALSQLGHPNIATIFDFDTQDGVDFLVMELIPGAALDKKLASGALTETEIATIGEQVAGALQEAHEHGIVHRDLKPGNIMVTAKGQVKVLDFGLAILLGPPNVNTTESFPDTKGLAGTLPYMAPEQLRGEPADQRTDIYALGVVLYEMTTGERPFDSRVSTALVDDIIHKPPVPPGRLKPSLSPKLEDIVLKSLEKEPENRYQSAREMVIDLRRLAITSSVTTSLPAARSRVPLRRVFALSALLLAVVFAIAFGIWRGRLWRQGSSQRVESLAVLPLANLSGDPAQDYFADGMTDELITQLAKLGNLRVISRTSVMRYKSTHESLPEIARQLNVDAIVEGSVERSGNRVRIRTQLIRASSEQHLWAESYDRELRDVLRLQSEAARDIVREIQVKLTSEQEQRFAGARPVNPEVYDLYLKGRYFWNKRTNEDFQTAIGYFNAAIERDPDSALPYVGLADCYNLSGSVRGKAAAEKALRLDESLAAAHASLAYAKQNYDWDFAGAEREFRRALELNPNYSTAHQWYSAFLSNMGRHEEAIAEAKRALDLDPLSVNINTATGMVYYFARQFDRSAELFKKSIELDPDFSSAHRRLAQVYLHKGMYADYLEEDRMAAVLSGKNEAVERIAAMRQEYASSGARAMFLKEIEWLQRSGNRSPDLPAAGVADRYLLAQTYVRVGDKDRAFQCLERGYRVRGFEMLVLKNDPQLDTLRSDPRFSELVRRVGLPQ
jgi:serine/threonine protein kinase/tetratricopeptide (TPR) repeat protein